MTVQASSSTAPWSAAFGNDGSNWLQMLASIFSGLPNRCLLGLEASLAAHCLLRDLMYPMQGSVRVLYVFFFVQLLGEVAEVDSVVLFSIKRYYPRFGLHLGIAYSVLSLVRVREGPLLFYSTSWFLAYCLVTPSFAAALNLWSLLDDQSHVCVLQSAHVCLILRRLIVRMQIRRKLFAGQKSPRGM